jgi:hypothetical protein
VLDRASESGDDGNAVQLLALISEQIEACTTLRYLHIFSSEKSGCTVHELHLCFDVD